MHSHWGMDSSSLEVNMYVLYQIDSNVIITVITCKQACTEWLVGMITVTSLLCDLRSFLLLPDFASSNTHSALGLDSAWSVKRFTSAPTGNLFGPIPSLCAGRGTASLQRSVHSDPYMKTHVVIKALLIPHGPHSCEMLLRRPSKPCRGVSGSWACCV